MKKAFPFVLAMALMASPAAVLADSDSALNVKSVLEINLNGSTDSVSANPELTLMKTLELQDGGWKEDLSLSGKQSLSLTFKTETGATSQFKLLLPKNEMTIEDWKNIYNQLGLHSDQSGEVKLQFTDGTIGLLHITALDESGNLRFEMKAPELNDIDQNVELQVLKQTFNITEGTFEKEVQLDSLTTLNWTFVKGDATADLNITLPGKQTPAAGWKEAFVQLNPGTTLDLDIAKKNAIPLTFSDGSQLTLTLWADVIGNSGKVRFWIEDDNQVMTTIKEDGLHLHLGEKGNYAIWVNGHKFGTVTNDNEIVLNKYLLKGNNRITCELMTADFKPFVERKVFKLYADLDENAQATLGNLLGSDTKGILTLVIPTKNGKTVNGNVEVTLKLDTDEPLVKGVYHIWVDNNKTPIVTTEVKTTLENLTPGTHQVTVEMKDENDKVVAGATDTFVVPTVTGGTLPKTATPWANVMSLGAVLMGAGAAATRKLHKMGK